MYVRILFLLCTFANLIKADYSSEAKYIDLLPENEKTEFLNRIARRIISEISSRSGTQTTSVEISDEKLNEHDAYVKKIMDEESQDMKNERRTEERLKNDKDKDGDFVELQVKPLEKDDPRDKETLDNVDLSASENKIRIKKGTSEINTGKSLENIYKEVDKLSTVPVHLLYDDTANLQSTSKMDNPEITVNENLGPNDNIEVILENTEKNDDEMMTDLNIESKDGDSTDQLNENLMKIRTNLNDSEGDNILKSQTIIYDFEPKQGEIIEYKNDTKENSSELVRAKQFELDEASGKWIELHPKNVTEDQLKASSVLDNVQEVTVRNEESTVVTIAEFITNSITNHTETDNILITPESTVKPIDYSGSVSNLQSVDATFSNKSVEKNVNVTESYLQPATPSNIYTTEYRSKDEIVASTIKVRSVSKEEEDEVTHVTEEAKAALRINREDLHDSNKKIRLLNNPTPSSSNYHNMNHYQVFEVGHDKPLTESKQIKYEYNKAPYYVPVYNFASKNAFYNPYNRFGPNNGNNPELIEVKDPYYNKEIRYEPSKLNSEPKHRPATSSLNNKRSKKDRAQRTFKYYRHDDEYEIENKIPFPKIPIMKGKVINIHFNPNDYLDMDYYLGRSNNDNPEQTKHVVKKGKPLPIPNSQDTSEEPIDPMSKEPHNMKEALRHIRLQILDLPKVDNRSKTWRSSDNKLKERLRIVDKILANPLFRGLNNSLVVFIPKTRTKIDTNDIRDNNIAVDYYFSRMSSSESPYLDDEVGLKQEHTVSNDDIADLLKKHILKTDTQDTQPVIEEQQLNIPLKLDNVLKIDLAMKGNNVGVLLRKVKKPKPSDFEILLNAYLSVLKDMVEYDNKGLLDYDWLGSAVDVQSALDKLMTLLNIMQEVRKDVHRYDRDLFRYVLFIFKTSLQSLVEAEKITKVRKRRSGINNRYKSKMSPDVDITHQFEAWREIKKYMREMSDLNIDVYNYLLNQLEDFLLDLQKNLNEFHVAIKGIASVTKYNRQRWYLDLKELYLTPLDRRVSLTLLLHLASTRLFGLIEESAKNGLEDDFILYVRTHKKEVERTREEFVLVLRLLRELNRLKK